MVERISWYIESTKFREVVVEYLSLNNHNFSVDLQCQKFYDFLKA